MPPTTLKLPVELKQRIQAVVAKTGQSVHAFMLEAIERETVLAEQRRAFVTAALDARAEFARDGVAYRAADVHRHVAERARGKRGAKPRATKWPK